MQKTTQQILTTVGILMWFKVIWTLAVFWQNDLLWLIVALLALFFAVDQNRNKQFMCAVIGALIGIAFDSVLSALGIYQFSTLPALFIPFWHMCIWLALIVAVQNTMRFLLDKLLLGAFLGAIAGTAAYYAAMRFGAVSFPYGDI